MVATGVGRAVIPAPVACGFAATNAPVDPAIRERDLRVLQAQAEDEWRQAQHIRQLRRQGAHTIADVLVELNRLGRGRRR
jgi:hypothetical protein